MSVAAVFLHKAKAAAKAHHPMRLTVRDLLAEWEAEKRGSFIVQEMTEDLQEAGLTTQPPFTVAGLDDEIVVVTAPEHPGAGARGTKAKPPVSSVLSAAGRQLLASVPPDGSSIGGAALRSAVGLDNDRYAEALSEVQRKGLIVVGPGRGGSIRRLNGSVSPVSTGPRKPESTLYEPFLQWLRSSWPPSWDEDEDKLREAQVTATPKGYKQKTGRWRRPDVTELRVYRYELLPPAQRIQLELSSYEIKPQGADLVEAVFEAASQARWAHRSTLVVEAPAKDWVASARILGDVRRFGLGLYYMTKVEATKESHERYDVTVVLEPSLQAPEPEDLQEAIEYFLGLEPGRRKKYKAAIG